MGTPTVPVVMHWFVPFIVTAPTTGLFEGRGNRDFATAVPLALQLDPLGTGLLRTEVYGYGSFDPTNDLDFFKFSAQAGDRVAVNVDPIGTSDSFVHRSAWLMPNGNTIASDTQSGPGNTAFISNGALTTTGEYFVRVTRGGGTTGSYRVRVDPLSRRSDGVRSAIQQRYHKWSQSVDLCGSGHK